MPRNRPIYQDPFKIPSWAEDPGDFPEITASPKAVLESHLPEEEPSIPAFTNMPGLVGQQPTGTEDPEARFQLRGGQVSDEQAQRWYEDTLKENARIKLEMLADEMLNSRKNLINELFEGDDPALQNTKPIRDELTKMEVNTLKESLGDPEEWTPEQKLRAATLKINIGRDARARVENEKQSNIQRLNDAVSQYNTGIAEQIKVIQGGVKGIQEKQKAEDEVAAGILEAQVKATTREPKAIKTWITPEDKIVHLPNNQAPPEGSKPYSDAQLTDKDKKLKDLATRYFQAVGRANSAKMGVGQFIPDPNREEIAQKEYTRARKVLEQYKAAGGDIADLGITKEKEYKSAEEVRGDYLSGLIDKATATKLLMERFPIK